MSFRLADKLRPQNAGFMLLGPVNYEQLIQIPPQQPAWTQDTICPAAATEMLLGNSSGVNIVAAFNHLHTVGRQVRFGTSVGIMLAIAPCPMCCVQCAAHQDQYCVFTLSSRSLPICVFAIWVS